ncbi:MAG: fibronectin type III domain-containing protein [Thermoplasmata archaeon]
MRSVRSRLPTLVPLVVLLLIASTSSSFAAERVEGDPGVVRDVTIQTDTSTRVALGRQTVIAHDTTEPDPTSRRSLHEGTYPVSPPPEAATFADRAGLDIGINKAPDGTLLLRARVSKAYTPPDAQPTSGHGPAPLATYTVQGRFQFEDRQLDERGFTGVTWMAPVRCADVEFYDVDSGQVLGTGSTNETGYFQIPISDGAVRNVSFRATTTSRYHTNLFNPSVLTLPRLGAQPYTLSSLVYRDHLSGTNIDFTANPVNATKETVGGPFHIFDLAQSAERYVENLTSAYPPTNLTVYWSKGYGDGKYYDLNGHVYLMGSSTDDDSYDDNVVLHEFGHYIALSYSADAGFYGPHGLAGTYDIRLSYTEGLGSYFMGAVRNFLNLTQPLIYIETNGSALNWFGFSLSYDTDTPSSYYDGPFQDRTSANEVAVAHALYDVVDGASSKDGTPGVEDDPMDLLSLVGDRLVWNVLVSIRENATLFTKAITMETFYDQWLLVNPGYASKFTQILLALGIEFAADGYEVDDTFSLAASVQTDGSLYHHTFYPAGEEDWSVFSGTSGTEYVIKTQDLLDGADTVLELYASDGSTLLASNNDRDASTRSSFITFSPAASRPYYVRAFRNVETPTPLGEYGKYNLTVYVLPRPEIVSVSPSSGPVQGGTVVNIAGFNFTAGATVRFGVYDATGLIVRDAYTISASTPANIPGSADIAILNPPNSDNLVAEGFLPGGFTYTGNALPPRIRNITPNFGTTTTSTNVTVEGDYFVAGATLYFDGIECASYTVVDPRTIAATVQPLPLAVYDVTVTNPDGDNDTLVNGFETASHAASDVESAFDGVAPLNTSLAIVDDFAVMDLYVYANVTHTPYYWAGVRLELESPTGRRVMVFDQIIAADSSGTTWRSGFSSVFGYDEAPSEVLWQFRGERTLGNWTLHLSSVPGVPGTLHSWGIYFFKYRHPEVTRMVFVAAEFRNYVAAFDEATGEPIYRVRLQAQNSMVAYPITVAVSRDQKYACAGGYSAYNSTRVGWTDSAITCFESTTGKSVKLFTFSGNLGIDGIEVPVNADRLVAVTNEYLYLIDTTTNQIAGTMPLPDETGPPHLGVTPDGRKAYVASPGKQHVLVVDLDAMAIVAQIDTPGYDLGDVDIASNGTFGIISSSGSPSALHKFDTGTDTIVETLPIPGFASQSVITPDDSRVFYTQFQWYAGFSRLELGTAAWRGFMPHPESTTYGIAMGKDGTLYVADWYVQRIWVYNSSTEALVQQIEVPDRPYLRGIDIGELVQRAALSAYGETGSVRLSWDTPRSYGTPILGYTIYRGDQSGEEVWHASVGPTNTYVDATVTNGQTYYYRVTAVNGAGEGAPSNEVSATPATVPTAPPNLQAATGDAQVTLTWQAPSANGESPITNYKVYRGTVSGSLTLVTTLGNVLTYTDTGLTNGVTYYYAVSAVNSVGEGPQSNEASATPVSVPLAPQNLQATAGDTQVTLTWQAPSANGGSPITNYKIYRGTASGSLSLLTTVGNVLTYTDTGLTNRQTYYYQVSAVNAIGEGPKSAEVSATPAPPADTTYPTVAITSPTAGSTLTSKTVTVSGTASDNVGVQKVELSTDGTTWYLASGTTSWSGTLTLGEGPNTIYARATDTSGNTATVTLSVTVQTPAQGPSPQGLDPMAVGLIIAAAVGVGAIGVALFLRRRRRRKTPGA